MRVTALASTLAFALLAAVLAGLGAIPWMEALWSMASVALAHVVTGLWGGSGVRRRLAEAVLVPAAFALTLVGDPTMRWMLVPPLLVLAGWAVTSVAWDRVPSGRRPLVAAFLGLSARAAVGLGLSGFSASSVALACCVAAVGPWAVARRHGRNAAMLTAIACAVLPWQRWSLASIVIIGLFLVWGIGGRLRVRDDTFVRWLPGVGAALLLATCCGPWAGVAPGLLLPDLGRLAWVAIVAGLAVTPLLRPGLAGAVWFLIVLTIGPAQPPSPEHRAFFLTPEQRKVNLPAGTGGLYVIDLDLQFEGELAAENPVAFLRFGGEKHPVHADRENGALVWRPRGFGANGGWRSAVRSRFIVPKGERPVLVRHPLLPKEAALRVETVGPVRPTPPRDWELPSWLLGAAVFVVVLQWWPGVWKSASSVIPWLLLVFGGLVARVQAEPLRLLGERLAVDLALAALVVAWFSVARRWLPRERVFATVAALLVPLALATPHLTPPMYGDEPFHLVVMESLVSDRDFDISDDLDLESHPQNVLYAPGYPFFQSPGLGVILLPGYLAGGRSGALVILALMGAALAALIARRLTTLGVGKAPVGLVVMLMASTYPLATFATQIWPELVGALAVAALLALAARPSGGRVSAVVVAVTAAAVRTRLALVAFPIAAVVWLRRGWFRGLAVLGAAAGAGLAIGWLTMGHPFGPYRRVQDLVPTDWALALRVIAGLAFDAAGGLAFTAPLLLAALAGIVALWRRGGAGERSMLLGCAFTVAALLHSREWYGGGAPPARYLVPMLPAFALAGGMALASPNRWRRLGAVLLPPSVVAWWVLITRPHLSINPGDGGYWLADALARRFAADGRLFFPSFLVPDLSTVVVPIALVVVVLGCVWLCKSKPMVGGVLRGAWVAVWLVAASALVATLCLRYDRVVEIEAPQVSKTGGSPVPRPGTASRFRHQRGWRLEARDRVEVPLRLQPDAEVVLEGRLLGTARRSARLVVRWDDGDAVVIPWRSEESAAFLRLPGPPGQGRRLLTITLRCQPNGAVVLDRLVVRSR